MSCRDGCDSGFAVEAALATPTMPPIIVVGTESSDIITTTIDLSTGPYRLNCWLADSQTVLDETLSGPDGTPETSWNLITDSDGQTSLVLEHSGVGTWYLVVELGGGINVSDAITFA